jgi:hypothetical protein
VKIPIITPYLPQAGAGKDFSHPMMMVPGALPARSPFRQTKADWFCRNWISFYYFPK